MPSQLEHQSRPRRPALAAGKIRPKRHRRPCYLGLHAGPFIPRPDITAWLRGTYNSLGLPPVIEEQGDCRACRSTVGRSRIRTVAA